MRWGLRSDIVSNSIDYSKRWNVKNIILLIKNDNFIEKHIEVNIIQPYYLFAFELFLFSLIILAIKS